MLIKINKKYIIKNIVNFLFFLLEKDQMGTIKRKKSIKRKKRNTDHRIHEKRNSKTFKGRLLENKNRDFPQPVEIDRL